MKSFSALFVGVMTLSVSSLGSPAAMADGSTDAAFDEAVSAAQLSAAELQQVEQAREIHEKRLSEMRANPHDRAFRKFRFLPGTRSKKTVNCVVAGAALGFGIQEGVCRGGGRKYRLTAVSLGGSVNAHAGYLRLHSTQDFDASTNMTGGRYGLFVGAGVEFASMIDSNADIKAVGIGLGGGIALDAIWLFLDPL